MSSEVLCYNKGCGNKFNPSANEDENACVHHPGVPVFHDALKGWSCCKRRTTDFSDFLNIPGCSKGRHSSVKPAEPVAPKVTSSKNKVDDKIMPEPASVTPKLLQTEPIPRPRVSEPMIPLPIKTTSSLQKALQKLSLEAKNEDPSKQIKICKFLSCRTTYSPGVSETCIHHPGAPVFHEGMKYWSCCQRKTSDFTAFLAQVGCVTGTHEWKVKSLAEAAPCRYDWHQTGSIVVISIFAKMTVEENSSVKVNQIATEIDLEFEGGKGNFKLDLEFDGVIDPAQSFVTLFGTKVEISLKKGDASHWKKLNMPETIQEPEKDEIGQPTEEKIKVKVEDKQANGDKIEQDEDDSDLSGIDDVEFD
ncbi:cysteine and histidine-rich domain-containing protein 1-like [Styela clava]